MPFRRHEVLQRRPSPFLQNRRTQRMQKARGTCLLLSKEEKERSDNGWLKAGVVV